MSRKSKRQEPTTESQEGAAPGGESINPSSLPHELSSNEKKKAAPPPGLPISVEEYNRLKKAATTSVTPDVSNVQQDSRAHKGKRGRRG